MSNILKNFTIDNAPHGWRTACPKHLSVRCKVAITQDGLESHNNHNLLNKCLIGGTIGLFCLPALAGGGIGIAMGGEAIGVGLAEIGLVGAGAGAAGAKALDKPVKGYLRDDKHDFISLVDMVGTVLRIKKRNFDQPGYDVQVKWIGSDEFGNRTSFTAWHNPETLYSLKSA